MAYSTSNPPRVVSQSIGAGSGTQWLYTDGDPIATVLATDYISNGDALGMAANDTITIVDETNSLRYEGIVSSVTADGAATLTVPEGNVGVISGSGATVTLTAAQSGSVIHFDRAAGIVFTLPTPVVGLRYKFITTVSLTSNAYTINTDAGTTFLVGAVVGAIEGAATDETHFANGSTHIGISSNATTTGGLIGGWLELECISSTLWTIKGVLSCTATPATPFTT